LLATVLFMHVLNLGRREMGRLADGQATAGELTGLLNIDILNT